jgi:RNA polymerase sigma factor (sigma-70 family)
MDDSRAVLSRAAAGDETAWREIVDRYQRLVFATIRSFRIDLSEAEDIFQEAFLRLHAHAMRVRDARALASWLIVTTRHLCVDHLARRQASARMAAALEPPVQPDSPLDLLIRLERAQEVREAIATLPPRCRDLLRALYFEREKPSYEDVAKALKVPVGSVGPTRARCLGQLLRQLRLRRARSGE